MQNGGEEKPLVEIVKTSADMGIIVVGPSKALSHISFLHLVEVAPARYLLALDSGYDFNNLEDRPDRCARRCPAHHQQSGN